MKLYKLLPSTFLITILIACGSPSEGNQEEQTTEAIEETESYEGMREADLSEYGVMATIMVPAENKGKLEVEESSWGSIMIKVGDDFGLEVVPFGLTLDEARSELDQGGVYEIEIVEENEAYLLYRKSIPNAEVKDEFHFFMNAEINGEIYEIKSLADMELKEAKARKILKSAKSFKEKPAA